MKYSGLQLNVAAVQSAASFPAFVSFAVFFTGGCLFCLYERAVSSPRNTFREEWDKVESSTIQVAKRYGWVNEGELVDCGQLINKLFEAEKIDKDIREEFFSLNKWHDNVVLFNSSPVEPGMAIHFANRARELQKAFNRLLRDLKAEGKERE